jgi:hypothetical protein
MINNSGIDVRFKRFSFLVTGFAQKAERATTAALPAEEESLRVMAFCAKPSCALRGSLQFTNANASCRIRNISAGGSYFYWFGGSY